MNPAVAPLLRMIRAGPFINAEEQYETGGSLKRAFRQTRP